MEAAAKKPLDANRQPETLTIHNPDQVRVVAEADFGRTGIDFISGLTQSQSDAFRHDPVLAPIRLPGIETRSEYERVLRQTVLEEITDKITDPEKHPQLGNLVFSAIGSLHATEAFGVIDAINGVDRNSGSENPIITPDMQQLLDESAQVAGMEYQKVRGQLDAATAGGGYAYFMTYLENFNGDPEVRRVMEETLTQRAETPELTKQKLRSYWNIYSTLKSFGLDFDQLAGLMGIPSTDEADDKLRAHLETLNGPNEDDLFSFLRNRAENRGFTDGMEAQETIHADVHEMRSLFPILEAVGNQAIIATHTGYGTEPRPVAVTYTNENGDKVIWHNVSAVRNRRELRQFLGHEVAHGAQSAVKEIARKNGYYGSTDEPPANDAVDEIFSQLVEEQVLRNDTINNTTNHDDQITEQDLTPIKEEDDALEALRTRKQTIQAIVNRSLQQKMDSVWTRFQNAEITEDRISEALLEADRAVQTELNELVTIGISTKDPTMTTQELYNPLFFFDGRVYQMGVLMGHSEDNQTTHDSSDVEASPSLDSILRERAQSDIWITNPDARTLLMNIFLQTGRDSFDPSSLADLARLPVEEAKAALIQAGIPGFAPYTTMKTL